jgi:hypothetical protein
MKCSHCGENNFDWARRCDHCGRPVAAQSAAGPTPSEFLEYSTSPQAAQPDVLQPPMGANVLRLDSVHFDEAGASEMDGRRALVFVPRTEIVEIELAHSTGVSNPWTVGIVGVAVLILSIGLPMLSLIASGGHMWTQRSARWGVRVWSLLAFALPAVWMIKLAVRKHWVVVIHSPKVSRHLIFSNPPAPEVMHAFLKSVGVRFGYRCTLDGGPAETFRGSTWRRAGLFVAAVVVAFLAWAMYRDRRPVPITATYDSNAYCGKLIWMEGRAVYDGKGTTYELYDTKRNGMVCS